MRYKLLNWGNRCTFHVVSIFPFEGSHNSLSRWVQSKTPLLDYYIPEKTILLKMRVFWKNAFLSPELTALLFFAKRWHKSTKIAPTVNAVVAIKSSSFSVLSDEHTLCEILSKGDVTRWLCTVVPRWNPGLPVLIFLWHTWSLSFPFVFFALLRLCFQLAWNCLKHFTFSLSS